MLKLAINGNSFIGAFCIATEKYALAADVVSSKAKTSLEKELKVKLSNTNICSSYLTGMYIAANSNGMLVPELAYRDEIEAIRAALGSEVQIEVMKTDLNALRNNILVNDKLAVINPEYSSKEVKTIQDILGVEVVKTQIGGFKTVGANNILTNKGIVFNNRIDDEEKDNLESMLNMSGDQSTANMGAVSIGLCTIANSHGLAVGYDTTGFEASRIEESLNLV